MGILSLFLGCQCFGTRHPEANLLGFASIHYNDLTAKYTNLIVQEQTLGGESSKRRAKGGPSVYCVKAPVRLPYIACLTAGVRLSVNLGWQEDKLGIVPESSSMCESLGVRTLTQADTGRDRRRQTRRH